MNKFVVLLKFEGFPQSGASYASMYRERGVDDVNRMMQNRNMKQWQC